jgi:hypothetical protein
MGQMEMKCIFDIGKKNSILAKATRVSDVAHGPLVCNICCYFDFVVCNIVTVLLLFFH